MGSPTNTSRVQRPTRALVAVLLMLFALPSLSAAAQLKLPKGLTEPQANTMYSEQLDSQRYIRQLAGGKIASFTVLDRKVKGNDAELKLSVKYTNGTKIRGTMFLVKADKVWFFKRITRDATVDEVLQTPKYDVGVVNTVLEEQVSHADTTEKIVNGTYRYIEIGKPKKGYRSVELPVTFTGAKGRAKVAGRVTCVQKMQRGEELWFITGFAQ